MKDQVKIKIALVVESLSVGGREKIVLEIANGLPDSKYDVHIILLSNDRNEQMNMVNKNVVVHCLPFKYENLGGLAALYFWCRGIFLLPTLLRKLKPDIIHTHLFFQQLLFVCVASKFSFGRAKHFHTVHTAGLFFSEKGMLNMMRLYTEKFSVFIKHSYIIAISDPVYKNCIDNFKKNASDIKCIYNGVDDKKFDYRLRDEVQKQEFGFTENDIIVTYVARMDEGKDHITLLRAWKEIVSHNSGLKLCLVGSGELRNDLETFVLEKKLSATVTFVNTISAVNRFLAITDIGVFPSLFEGFSIAVLEKMFMKVPVIATNIPANAILIKDGVSGFLFEPKDTDALAKKLTELIKNKSLRVSVGNKAFEAARPYNITSMISQHERFFEGALA